MPKTAIVTGAASGIGKATTDRLLKANWQVIGLDMAYAAGSPSDAGSDSFSMLHCDVSSATSIDNTFAEIASRFAHVDAIVCSAGKLATGSLVDMAVEDFDRIYQINTRGAWLCACHAVHLMRSNSNKENAPRIVFLGSISGIRPKISGGAYGAQKADAVMGLGAHRRRFGFNWFGDSGVVALARAKRCTQ